MNQSEVNVHKSTESKGPSIRPNIIMLLYVFWFLYAPHLIWRILPHYPALFGIPLGIWIRIVDAIFMAIIPALIYFMYVKFFTKQRIRDILSIARLNPRNILYITVITLAFALTYGGLLGYGIPFFFSDTPMPMRVSAEPTWQILIRAGIIAALAEELIHRGILHGEYSTKKVAYWKIALVVGLSFGLIHVGVGAMSVIDTTFSGVFLYAPLIYLTRSIWAPVLHHVIVNSLSWINLANFVDNQADHDAFMPIYMIILAVVVAILIPAAVICGKKFWALNKHNHIAKKDLPKESKAFKLTYWATVAIMLAAIVSRLLR